MTQAALADIKGISNIRLHSHIDIVEEVHGSSFSVDSVPDSEISIGGLMRFSEQGTFSVVRVGKWTFRVSGRAYLGAYKADTGEPVEGEYYGSHIEFGANSPYRDMFPFEVNTVQDIVDHYSELVELLEMWPREAEPGTVTLEDGTTQYFYVVDESK
jgi:hypothetical protein